LGFDPDARILVHGGELVRDREFGVDGAMGADTVGAAARTVRGRTRRTRARLLKVEIWKWGRAEQVGSGEPMRRVGVGLAARGRRAIARAGDGHDLLGAAVVLFEVVVPERPVPSDSVQGA